MTKKNHSMSRVQNHVTYLRRMMRGVVLSFSDVWLSEAPDVSVFESM
ncbi:MAG: hypothetical protein RTU92_09400 [Candidatus Thorarchaeota archaeon]